MCNEQEKIKNFTDFDKFPQCSNLNCLTYLEIQNRFRCNDCDKFFCNEHRLKFNHECLIVKSTNVENYSVQKFTKCCKKNCNSKLTLLNQFICKSCNKKYCLSHRHDFSHECVKKKN